MNPSGHAGEEPRWPSRTGPWYGWVLEAVLACGAAAAVVALAATVDVDPVSRVGQVSASAALQAVFALVAIAAVVMAALLWRLRGDRRGVTAAAAVLAGLTTGTVAGGVLMALDGTPWGLFADGGDAAVLAGWAEDLRAGVAVPGSYPPGYVWLLAAVSAVTDWPAGYALKLVQIGVTAAVGPIGYLAWRFVAGPVTALLLGVVAALPLVEAYKPVSNLSLVVLLALLVLLVRRLRTVRHTSTRRALVQGLTVGAALGVVFLVYSGWFVWTAPGAIVLLLCSVPWTAGREVVLRAAVQLGSAAAALGAVSAVHAVPLLTASQDVKDTYFYFDALVDPGYYAMWRNDLPGEVGMWPPPGELGGVGVFTLLLAAGLTLSVACGWRSSVVRVALAALGSAWVLRFVLASQMQATGSVQLWPRTSAQLLYCLLVLSVVGAASALFRAGRLVDRSVPGEGDDVAAPAVGQQLRSPGAQVAVLVGACLVLAGSSSALVDRYMPRDDGSSARLAWVAHTIPLLDGSCPSRAPEGTCAPRP